MENVMYEANRDMDQLLYVGISENLTCQKHFHRNFELLYILDGSMSVTVNNSSFEAKADDIVFVSNFYTHEYQVQDHCEKYCMVVPFNISADYMSRFKKKTLPSLLTDHKFNRKIKKILADIESKKMPSMVQRGYILVIFGMLLDHYPQVDIESNSDVETIVQILNYIDENYANPISLDSISQAFGYNKYYFSKIFNRNVRENLTTYVNIIRIQHLVKRAVKEPRPNISALAFDVGFDSLSTFYRYFASLYGCSPAVYLSDVKKKK